MIGVPTVFGTQRFVKRPGWDLSDEQLMQVWLSPSRPRWDYVPIEDQDGPFWLIRTDGEHIYWAEDYRELVPALQAFVRHNLPHHDESCCIVDRHLEVIVGWTSLSPEWEGAPDTVQRWANEDYYQWVGCRFVFNLLAQLHNPVDVALWERHAQPEERL